jgi:hypothetical protein
MSITYTFITEFLEKISKEVAPGTHLVLIGAVPCILMGQGMSCTGEVRATLDIDVWKRDSKYKLENLKSVCLKHGLGFNPTGYNEPTTAYLQLVEPDLVFLPANNGVVLFTKNNLTVSCPDPICYISSKLVRCNTKDAADCALIAQHFNLTKEQIAQAATRLKTCKGITYAQLEQAQENITLVQQYVDIYN